MSLNKLYIIGTLYISSFDSLVTNAAKESN